MPVIRISDESIWLKHIEGDKALRERIRNLAPEEVLDLEVNGVVGKWARMKDGKDGRPTWGIKPVGEMRLVWTRMRQQQTGKIVTIREVTMADSYLVALSDTLDEWSSQEDELAYADL
jgi:hypothetical protein